MNFARDVVEAADPRRLALVERPRHGHPRREWSFGRVARFAGTVAHHFDDLGLRRGDVILTLVGNRPEWVLTMVACFHQGYVVLPCTEQLRPKDLRQRLEVARPALVVCDERNEETLPASGCRPSTGSTPAPESSCGAPPPAAGASRRATSSSRRGCAGRPRCCTTS